MEINIPNKNTLYEIDNSSGNKFNHLIKRKIDKIISKLRRLSGELETIVTRAEGQKRAIEGNKSIGNLDRILKIVLTNMWINIIIK